MASYNTEEILRESQDNVKKLNEKLKDIETLHNEIKESVSLSIKNPVLFKELAEKLNDSAELYLKGNNTIFDQNISEISNKISELGSEITRLSALDFSLLFQDLETKFLKDWNVKIDTELKKIDEKSSDLQTKIKELDKEVTRLSKIDLEDHFNKHQSKLSEVFISVNGINSILTSVSQNFNKIIQNFGDIEQTLTKNQKEIDKHFDSLTENNEKSTKNLLSKINESEVKLSSIILATESLKKDVNFNKKLNIIIIGFLIVITILLLK